MESFGAACGLAAWLGVLTSISPCPLATNIAAMSFIGRRVGSTAAVLLTGLLYVAGRVVAYLALGAVIVAGLVSIPGLATFLQTHLNRFLGPLLIVIGMILLELLTFEFSTSLVSDGLQSRAGAGGAWWAFILGVLFGLSFCPVSAALFFGSLIPVALRHGSVVTVPALYGIGGGLPAALFAVVVAVSAKSVGTLFARVQQVEWWARRLTGAIFVVAGIYYSLVYVYGVL